MAEDKPDQNQGEKKSLTLLHPSTNYKFPLHQVAATYSSLAKTAAGVKHGST